jgi:EpsI family protein
MKNMTARFVTAGLLIASTAIFMQAHNRQEVFPPRQDLQGFPPTLGPWIGTGWAPIENTRIRLSMPGHQPFPVNRYVISKQDARQIVLYWFWAHNRGVASEYWNKYYLVADSIKMNRSDGALIRITSPIQPGETADAAQQRISPFVNSILPLLDDYIPR